MRFSCLFSGMEKRASCRLSVISRTSFLRIVLFLSYIIISRGHFLGQIQGNSFFSCHVQASSSVFILIIFSERISFAICFSSNIRCSLLNSSNARFHPYAKLDTITPPIINIRTRKAMRLILRASFLSVESIFIMWEYLWNEVSNSFHCLDGMFSEFFPKVRYMSL